MKEIVHVDKIVMSEERVWSILLTSSVGVQCPSRKLCTSIECWKRESRCPQERMVTRFSRLRRYDGMHGCVRFDALKVQKGAVVSHI